jgi:hypothetical protein
MEIDGCERSGANLSLEDFFFFARDATGERAIVGSR